MEPVQSMWYVEDDDDEDLMFSPALMARRASESWITTAPVEVRPTDRRPPALPPYQPNNNNNSNNNNKTPLTLIILNLNHYIKHFFEICDSQFC